MDEEVTSSESETEGADLSHVSSHTEISEDEDDEPQLFLKCKPSMKKNSNDTKTEEKDKEDALNAKEQQTELTGKAVDDLMTRVKVGYLHGVYMIMPF